MEVPEIEFWDCVSVQRWKGIGCATYGATVVPGGEDGDTGGVTVDGGAVVGEGSERITAVSGTDSEDRGLGSGGNVGCSLGLVTGSDGKENTGRDDGGGRAVDGGGLAASERHVGNGTVGAAAGLRVGGYEVDTSNDTRVSALCSVSQSFTGVPGSIKTYGAAGVEHLDGIELSLLSNTVGLGTNGSSNVGAVTIAIGVLAIAGVVGKEGGTTLKLRVGSVDTSVNDVGTGSGASGGVVDVRGRALADVGDTAETPGSTRLGSQSLLLDLAVTFPDGRLHDGVLLNVLDLDG